MLKKIAFAFLLFAPCAASAQERCVPQLEPLEEADGPTIGYDTVAEALAAVRSDPSSRVVMDFDWLVIEVGKIGQPDYALWNFSPPSHPAHPAAVKRTIHMREGQLVVDMDVACEAEKPDCDRMVREFQAITERFQHALNASHEP